MHTGGIGTVGNPKLESVICAHCRGANKVILNWQRPLWEGDLEVVKRSGRDESFWVVIYKCMDTMLAISLYIYLYLKLPEMLCLSYFFYVFSSTKLEKRAEQVLPGSERGRGERWPKQCMHI
jgi:hypothetical protein